LFTWTAFAGAAEFGFYRQGDVNLNGPWYEWWYGCTPTSAGMMMGYYDQKGYGGLSYDNLVPGGVAEAKATNADGWSSLANSAIASKEHVNDYYRAGYLGSGDDLLPPYHANNCLADFMGTSQDSFGNVNGSTTLYFWNNGAKTYAKDVIGLPDGMLGMNLYFRYAGYGTGDIRTDLNFYTQGIYNFSHPNGMTFAQYKAEIDAGRVVMIHVEGHSMFGYGYTDNNEIIFDDTWNGHDLRMAWGDSYSGMDHWGVTCFTPTGGGSVVPLPSTVFLMGSGLLGLVLWKRRKP
jgi:hypothetical protein